MRDDISSDDMLTPRLKLNSSVRYIRAPSSSDNGVRLTRSAPKASFLAAVFDSVTATRIYASAACKAPSFALT